MKGKNTKKKRCKYYRDFIEDKHLNFPVIDHHGHLGTALFSSLPLEEEVQEIISVLDSVGIDRAVVFPFHYDYKRGNDIIIKGVSLAPERFIGYATLIKDNLTDMMKELERCLSSGMKGLKLHSFFGDNFKDPVWKDVWKFCALHKWPVIIHGMVPSLARENPDTIFIHAHGIGELSQEVIKTIQECSNYYLCTSATITLMGAIEEAVNLFGAERLIYGSDLPLNNPATRIGAVLTAKISEEDIQKILGGNIIRLLDLKIKDTFPR